MLQKIKIAVLTAFVLSVGCINLWGFLKLEDKFADTPADKILKLISHNFQIDEYAFFSPGIADSYNISFLTKNKATGQFTQLPIYFYNTEMENKIFSVLHKFYTYYEIRDYVAHSLVSYFFQQNETADEVIFCFSVYKLPSPKEYSNSNKPHTELIYAREYFNE